MLVHKGTSVTVIGECCFSIAENILIEQRGAHQQKDFGFHGFSWISCT